MPRLTTCSTGIATTKRRAPSTITTRTRTPTTMRTSNCATSPPMAPTAPSLPATWPWWTFTTTTTTRLPIPASILWPRATSTTLAPTAMPQPISRSSRCARRMAPTRAGSSSTTTATPSPRPPLTSVRAHPSDSPARPSSATMATSASSIPSRTAKAKAPSPRAAKRLATTPRPTDREPDCNWTASAWHNTMAAPTTTPSNRAWSASPSTDSLCSLSSICRPTPTPSLPTTTGRATMCTRITL